MAFNIFDFLPSHFKTPEGTFLDALLRAVESSQGRLLQAVEKAVDQQFLTTATGRYLLYLGEQSGFVLPPNSGLDIRALRALVPIVAANPKQVADTLNRLVEAFYGSDKVRAAAIAETPEPYAFVDGDDLIVETDSGSVAISFLAAQFSDIQNISAPELASLINSSQSLFIADPYTDRKTNERFLRVSSRTAGIGASIKIIGGTAQNVLRLPKIVPTSVSVGSGWTVVKGATYSDVTRITWTGVGSNPEIFKVKPGDTVTIRGLIDGATSLSALNGSYLVEDSGFDYFVIHNSKYQSPTDFFTLAEDGTFVFTSQLRNGIYDNSEYVISSETQEDTVAFTVPAVPPIARRFLAGSSHLHGAELPVLDFTRSSVEVENSQIDTNPSDDNTFILTNENARYDFAPLNTYKTSGSNAAMPRTYIVESGDATHGVLPFTNTQPLASDAIYAVPGSEDFEVTFPYGHGLKYRWGFTLSASSGAGNISQSQLSREHLVVEVIDTNRIRFNVIGASGNPVKFSGVAFSNFDVFQWSVAQSDGSDFYLEFGTLVNLAASGLEVGTIFSLDPVAGTSTDSHYGVVLRYHNYRVESVLGTRITFRTGFGTGLYGKVIENGVGYGSASFGGTVAYHFDKTSPWNSQYVLRDLRALFIEYGASSNRNYVGSFVFDPSGAQYQNTVSGKIVETEEEILKGATPTSIAVDDVTGFPKSGIFLIDYGNDRAEGPVPYLSTIQGTTGASQIIIDPSYKFRFTHEPGALIWHVKGTAPFVPDILARNYPVYLTGTAAARNTLLELLKLLVASGIFIDFNVLFPDLRFADTAIEPFA